MNYPLIEDQGAKDGVTGLCHQLRMNASSSLLIDCGLFQDNDASIPNDPGADRLAIEFPLETIKALVATHVHIDHVGRIPYLLAAGFEGSISRIDPSAKLLPIVLEDAFKLSFSRDKAQIEKYIRLVEQRLLPLPYQQWLSLINTGELVARIRLQRAGHILGSAYVEVDLTYLQTGQSKRVVFSCDRGAPHAPFLMPPEPPERADILLLERTYGDRLHEDRQNRRQRLEAVIGQALQDQGTVLIPAFSIGRTQELLYELEEIVQSKQRTAVDQSPRPSGERATCGQLPLEGRGEGKNNPHQTKLARAAHHPRLTARQPLHRSLKPFWNQEARDRIQCGRRPLAVGQFINIDSHGDHQRIVNHVAQTARPAIVIAGGSTCSGGGAVSYLKAKSAMKAQRPFCRLRGRRYPTACNIKYGLKGDHVELDRDCISIVLGLAASQ